MEAIRAHAMRHTATKPATSLFRGAGPMRSRNWRRLALMGAVTLLQAPLASAAAANSDAAATTDIQLLEYQAEVVGEARTSPFLVIEISGPLTKDAPDRLRAVLDHAIALNARARAKPEALPVYLNSPGGSVLAAIEMGETIRELGVATHIDDMAKCASACALVFAGGVQRSTSNRSASIGIHRPYFPSEMFAKLDRAEARERYDELTQRVRDYLQRMGMSDRLFERMLRIPSNTIEWLKISEAKELGLIGEDPAFAEWVRARRKRDLGEREAQRFELFGACLRDREESECLRLFPRPTKKAPNKTATN